MDFGVFRKPDPLKRPDKSKANNKISAIAGWKFSSALKIVALIS
jgi:hypothetical protein